MENNIEYEMKFVPEPVCWTEVPESLSVLRSQRVRWQQGCLEVFFTYKKMFFNPKYKRIGMISLPLIFLADVLSPVLELTGLILLPIFYLLGAVNHEYMVVFFCLFVTFGVFISIMSLILEEMSLKRFKSVKELMILWAVSVVENFGYRQFNNVWRIVGCIDF